MGRQVLNKARVRNSMVVDTSVNRDFENTRSSEILAVDVSNMNDFTNTNTLDCQLCKSSTQHRCRKCSKFVCNLICSIQDPSSDNESHRIHRNGDPRCLGSTNNLLMCPKCKNTYSATQELNVHLQNEHSQFEDLSELSLASIGSLSQMVDFKCEICEKSYENEKDLHMHNEAVHDHNSDISELLLIEDDAISRKRKLAVAVTENVAKKVKKVHRCLICKKDFSRKDSLDRHNKNLH